MNQENSDKQLSIATFAGGCFWCLVAPYESIDGVEAVISGFSGGEEKNPGYMEVVSGMTGHREAVQVHYDPEKVDYKTLVEAYWKTIDPTDAGGQFADRGKQYQTAIFVQNDEEQSIADESKQALEDSGKFDESIATEVLPFTSFYPAEDKHQQYYLKNPTHYELYKEGSGRGGFLRENWNG
jgi:peptide methionine sulfoxide reductase msrA/msrB